MFGRVFAKEKGLIGIVVSNVGHLTVTRPNWWGRKAEPGAENRHFGPTGRKSRIALEEMGRAASVMQLFENCPVKPELRLLALTVYDGGKRYQEFAISPLGHEKGARGNNPPRP